MKESLIEKAQRKLSNNFPDYEYDASLLGDYFDDAIQIIIDWKMLIDTESVLTGKYDRNIVQFIIMVLSIMNVILNINRLYMLILLDLMRPIILIY